MWDSHVFSLSRVRKEKEKEEKNRKILFSWKEGPTPRLSSEYQYWINTITCKFLRFVLFDFFFLCLFPFFQIPLYESFCMSMGLISILSLRINFIWWVFLCAYACSGISHALKFLNDRIRFSISCAHTHTHTQKQSH